MLTGIPLVQLLPAFIWFIALSCTVIGTWAALKQLDGQPPHLDAPFSLYPVSVIKPLKGVDPGLEENLRTFFAMDYPDFELLFCVPNAGDPSYPLIQRLIAQYPQVNSRLFVGEVNIGPNPKINNILKAYESAKNDYVLISDSNVRVKPSYLRRLVAHLSPRVGMVTAIVAGKSPEGVGGKLEATYLNTFYARWMAFAGRLGKPCVVGKSMLFQRSTAARFGGLRVLSKFLAEDYMAGEAVRKLGLEVVIARDAVDQIIGDHSLHAFWSRHLRWGRIRKAQALPAFMVEPLMGAFGSGFFGAYALHTLLGVSVAKFLFVHLCLWSLCDFTLMRKLEGRTSIDMPLYWFLREILAFPLWLHIGSGRSILWRGQRFTLQAGGTLLN